MVQPLLSNQFAASSQGQENGQLRAGRYSLQIGGPYGNLVVEVPSDSPAPVWESTPCFPPLLGDSRQFLDRQLEIATASRALQAREPLEICGPPGVGKSTLLNFLLSQPEVRAAFQDGVVVLPQLRSVTDLLQFLFEQCYRSQPPYRPTDSHLRQSLTDKRLLLVFDPLSLAQDELEGLREALPQCGWLLASGERRLWHTGQSLILPGLPAADGMMLVARELERAMTPEEHLAAQDLVILLQGHPQALLQAVALVRETRQSLVTLVQQLRLHAEAPERSLVKQVLASLPSCHRQVVAVLVALVDLALLPTQIAGIIGMSDSEAILTMLHRWHLVRQVGDRYQISANLEAVLGGELELDGWMEATLTYVTSWSEQQANLPALLAEQALLLRALEWAVQHQRWAAVARLGLPLEQALAFGRRWGSWGSVLQGCLQAAWELRDQAMEARVLHQWGTRAFCLEDLTTAYDAFTQALHLRKTQGDEWGAAFTHHHLDLLLEISLPPAPPERSPSSISANRVNLALLIIGLVAFLLSGLTGLFIAHQFNQLSSGDRAPSTLSSPTR